MAKIAKNLTELIGHTPLMELAEYSRKYGLKRNIVAKLESFNPAGSVKDRVAFAMIEDAEARGALKPGATIIEPTSGNTGVGLAMVATIKGYHLILTMPYSFVVCFLVITAGQDIPIVHPNLCIGLYYSNLCLFWLSYQPFMPSFILPHSYFSP